MKKSLYFFLPGYLKAQRPIELGLIVTYVGAFMITTERGGVLRAAMRDVGTRREYYCWLFRPG